MYFRSRAAGVVALWLGAAGSLFAQTSAASAPSIAARRTATPIQIDGRLADMRRNFGQLRFSPRHARMPHVRKVTTLASLNYVTNSTNWRHAREAVGQFQTEFTNSDVVSATYTDSSERLVRLFAIAPGIRIPVGTCDFRTVSLSYTGGQQRRYSGAIVYEGGPFYTGDRHSIAVNSARMEVTPQFSAEPSVSVNWVDLKEGSFTTKVARLRGTYTMTPRMYVSGIVQYNSTSTSLGSNLRFRWEYRPGSELFVVYTDDYDTEARPAVTPLRNRAFVVKVNRLLRPQEA